MGNTIDILAGDGCSGFYVSSDESGIVDNVNIIATRVRCEGDVGTG